MVRGKDLQNYGHERSRKTLGHFNKFGFIKRKQSKLIVSALIIQPNTGNIAAKTLSRKNVAKPEYAQNGSRRAHNSDTYKFNNGEPRWHFQLTKTWEKLKVMTFTQQSLNLKPRSYHTTVEDREPKSKALKRVGNVHILNWDNLTLSVNQND